MYYNPMCKVNKKGICRIASLCPYLIGFLPYSKNVPPPRPELFFLLNLDQILTKSKQNMDNGWSINRQC